MFKGFKREQVITNVNQKLAEESFISKHKVSIQDFTRNRTLTFAVVFMLIFRKSIKSLQLTLNELLIHHWITRPASASAYTQARKKFKHTAFKELNDDTIKIYESDDSIKLWKGYRCMGVDGSKIVLPSTKEVREVFGEIKIKNQHVEGIYTAATFECCYDVLNQIAVQSFLAPASSYEVDLAIDLLEAGDFSERDVFIYDRGYASYELLAKLTQHSKHYVVRCPKNSFKPAKSLFDRIGCWSKVVTLAVHKNQKKFILEKGLPVEIKVRFVSVILSTGEVEVLVTSLMEESIRREDFQKLYFLRWGVETFFSLIKGRLNLENFTGKTLESVQQDFWSTIMITNIESVLTEEIETDINTDLKPGLLAKKINQAVSFNAIKNMAFEIFNHEKNVTQSLERLTLLFKTNTLVQRTDRAPPRKKTSHRKSYNFLRRIKKQVF